MSESQIMENVNVQKSDLRMFRARRIDVHTH